MSLVRAFTPACSPTSKAIRSGHDHLSLDGAAASPRTPKPSPSSLRGSGEMQPLPRPSLADHWPQDQPDLAPNLDRCLPAPLSALLTRLARYLSGLDGLRPRTFPRLLNVSPHRVSFLLPQGAPGCSSGVPLPGRRLLPLAL